jgi:putative transposase
VTIDNTLAAANKTMSGGIKHRFRFKVRDDEPDGVFKLLGVDVHWATPGHGQAKPIERAFGVGGVGEYIDKAPEFAGAWSGSSTKDKPEYDGRTRRSSSPCSSA